MNLPNLATLVPKLKTYAIIAGALLAFATGLYFKGHSDGYDESDNKWKAAIADSKFNTTKVETTFVATKPTTGHFTSTSATVSASYQAKVDRIIADAKAKGDSLEQINASLEYQLRLTLEPRLIHLVTPTIGDLVLQYFPADDSANVYSHQPPPERVVTVFRDKVVVEPQSTWTTVGYVALGTGVGILVAVIAHIK